MNLFTEDKIIDGLKRNDRSFLDEVYTEYYTVIERFIIYNTGTADDARDIFQEAFIIIYLKVQNEDFELNCSFLTYLYSVVKNLWLKELRGRRVNGIVVKDLEEVEDVDVFFSFEKEYEYNIEYFMFRKHFNTLSRSCRQILKLFFERLTFEEIAEILNYSSSEIVRKRKYRCKETLIRTIKRDPLFSNID